MLDNNLLKDKILNINYFCDLSIANIFAEYICEDVKYIQEISKWCVYNGKYWAVQNNEYWLKSTYEKFIQTIATFLTVEKIENQDENSNKICNNLAKFISKAGSFSFINSLEANIKNSECLCMSIKEFNTKANLLNCINGTYNLETKEFEAKHYKEYYFTTMTNAPYNPNAKCPIFEKFMSEILSGQNLSYAKMTFAQILSDENNNQACSIFGGNGANGKTTLVESIIGTMGNYVAIGSSDIFKNRNDYIPKKDFISTWDKRLLFICEMNADDRLGEKILKLYCGNDTIKVKINKDEFINIKNKCKFALVTNHMAEIKTGGYALHRRLKTVKFEKRFKEGQRDETLQAKLLEENDGILLKLIEWYDDYKSGKLNAFANFDYSNIVEQSPFIPKPLKYVLSRMLTFGNEADFVTLEEVFLLLKQYGSVSDDIPDSLFSKNGNFKMNLAKFLKSVRVQEKSIGGTKIYFGIGFTPIRAFKKLLGLTLFFQPYSNIFDRFLSMYKDENCNYLDYRSNDISYRKEIIRYCNNFITESGDKTLYEKYQKKKCQIHNLLKEKTQ